MGCDIHPYYEIQQPDGTWKIHDYRALHETAGHTNYDALFNDPLYISRHYRFFAFLADVRNGSGFAGCDTGDAVEPIDGPRGVPEDATDFYKARVYEYGVDGHSHSWFTGDELRDADWDQTTVERGYISLTDYPRFKAQGNLDNIRSCGDIHGGDIVKLMQDAADKLMEQATPESLAKDDRYYVKVEYARALKEELEYDHDTWLPAVLALHEDPTKVRVCFFFDN